MRYLNNPGMIPTSVKQTELEQTAIELLDLMIRKGGNAFGRLQELLAPEMSGFGTGKNEIVLKLDDYLPLFEREAEGINNADYKLLRITPKVAGNTGVVEGEFNILTPVDKDMVPVYARFTFVFTLENGIWKGVSCHLSTPTADQAEGETFAFDAIKERNQELEKLVADKTTDLAQKIRELQIEAALEIVRARTMAMQRSDELADVATLLFQQVRDLGIETWTTGFNVWLKDDTAYQDFVTSPEGGFIKPYTIDLTQFPVFIEIREAKLRGEEFFVRLEEGNVIKETYQHLMTYAPEQYGNLLEEGFQFPLQQYEHFVFGKTVSLMFITYKPVPEAHAIFKRFGKVFEQTYTRFLDLQKAEWQAREAQIEAALEKIRSRSLAMHSSGELKDVIATMFEKLDKMKVAHGTVAIQLFDFETKDSIFWPGNTLQKVAPKVRLPFDQEMMEADTCHRDLWKAMEKKEIIFNKVYTRQQKDRWFKYVFAHNDSTIIEEQARDFIRKGETHTVCFVPEKNAALFADSWDGTCYSEDELTLLRRVAKVFDQAYTRFLDLQKAEAQAREAQIEVSLERVRSRAMSMQHSKELGDLIGLIYRELNRLDIVFDRCFIMLFDELGGATWWMASPESPDGLKGYYVEHHDHKPHLAYLGGFRAQAEKWNYTLAGQEKKEWDDFIFSETDLKQFPPAAIEFMKAAKAVFLTATFNRFGCLTTGSYSPLEPTSFDILLRFSKMFEQTYTRFLDLQKAEAQVREAQIEAALERVRTRTMAMHRSDELAEAAVLLFQQVKSFGLQSWGCGFNIWDKDDNEFTGWMSSPEGKLVPPSRVSLNEHPLFIQFKESRQKGVDFYVLQRGGKELEEFYQYLLGIPILGEEMNEFLKSGGQLPTFQIDHVVNFSHGNLIFITYEPVPEAQDIFKRFGKVFEQTYTRFLDLKKAEAQAREAQIEAALERVRARTIAMRESSELIETAELLFDQLGQLGAESQGVAFAICDKESVMVQKWASIGVFSVPYTYEDGEQRMYEAWKDQIEIYEEVYEGVRLKKYYELFMEIPEFRVGIQKFIDSGHPLPSWQKNHAMPFKYGYLLLITSKPFEETQIFIRFAKVFEQTYTRFLDLKKAEAQAREARVETAMERIRAKALAMHQSDELMEVALTLREQMGLLGQKELEASVIQFYHLKKETIHSWHVLNTPGSEKGDLSAGSFEISKNACQLTHRFFTEFQSEKTEYSIVAEGELLWDWLEYLRSISLEINGSINVLKLKPGRTFFHFSKFSEGALLMVSSAPATEEAKYLQRRAAQVFELANKRYKDLKQAEKLAKKAKLDFIRLKEEKKRTDEALKELTATQAQLTHAEKMASLGQLTAGIAHEIQNPLNFVNNFSEISTELVEELRVGPFLKLPEGDRKEAGDILEDLDQNLYKIHHHGQRADAIVKNMLLHSRASTGQKEPTDINALADEYLRLAYYGLRAKDKSFNANLVTELDSNIGKVKVVPQDLGRVLLNLYNNAFYATQEKKSQLNGQYQPEVKVTTNRLDGRIEIRIRDNGTGIPENVKNKVFQPFFTTKPTGQGTGLGLSLAYDIVTKGHGGGLSVASEQGEWAEFIITLPHVPIVKEPTLKTASH